MACTVQVSDYAARQLRHDCIDLSAGYPSPAMLPDVTQIVSVLSTKQQQSPSDAFRMTYGPRKGSKPFREALAAFLARQCSRLVSAEQLMATAGVSHGLDLACGILAAPGDTVAVEAPTYYLAHQIFDRRHLQVAALRTDEWGLDTDALAARLEADPAFRPKLLYAIPVHNNPCGTVLPASRRAALVALAHKYGFTILADEVYQLLTFPGAPPPPPSLRTFEEANIAASPASRVLSVSSFSKIFAPGLRLGWLEGSPAVLDLLAEDGVINSGGCINHFTTSIGEMILEAGMVDRQLADCIQPRLAAQCRALCQALVRHLPGLAFHRPDGGYFVWLPVPPEVQEEALLQHCQSEGVRVHPGHLCGASSGTCLRLSFSFYTEAELELAVERLAAALRASGLRDGAAARV